MAKLTIGTLSEILAHGGEVCGLLQGGNLTQTIARIKAALADPALMNRLMRALDGLEGKLRIVHQAEVDV